MRKPVKSFGDLYEADDGFRLEWHSHVHKHGHRVLRGRTLVECEGLAPFEMTAADTTIVFESNMRHQITVVENNTMFFNEQKVEPPPLGKAGGVLLNDGTVVR